MKVINTGAPFIRQAKTARSAMLTTALCLCFVTLFASFLYGPRAALLALISVLVCMACESLIAVVSHLPNTVGDFSAAVTGLIIALLLPVTIPVYILVIADAFAIILAKGVFGGLGHNPFNPAACAFSFVAVSWPSRAFVYVLPLQEGALAALPASPSAGVYLKDGGLPPFRVIDALLGNLPSAMGTACFAVLLACFVMLCAKGVIRWRITLSFVVSAAVFAALFNRTGKVGASVFWELFSGALLFAAVFMVTDPSTSPKSRAGSWIYGALCGLTVILMRTFGAYEEGLCFALILCNAVAPTIDRAVAFYDDKKWRAAALARERSHRRG